MGCDDSKQARPQSGKAKGEKQGTLYYFDGHGRAEFLRLMLIHSGINWEDKRLSNEEWGGLKPTFPPGGLPCWVDKDIKLNETDALARFLAKKLGYHPTQAKAAWDVDATFDFLYEQWGKMAVTALMGKDDQES